MSHSDQERRAEPTPWDASACEREPIHTPNAIQPHGAFLAARVEGRLVSHASANLAAIVGQPVADVLGRPLKDVFGEAACGALERCAGPRNGTSLSQVHGFPGPDGSTLCLHAYLSGAHICVDIEPIRRAPGPGTPVTLAQSVLETFSHAATRADLCDFAVHGLRSITGYDRVMAYRFGPDGHCEVIAEACAPQSLLRNRRRCGFCWMEGVLKAWKRPAASIRPLGSATT